MNIPNNQATSAHQQLAALKPSSFLKNPPITAFKVPFRAGPAPLMKLWQESSEEDNKVPEVDIKGDADSLKMLENYQDH